MKSKNIKRVLTVLSAAVLSAVMFASLTACNNKNDTAAGSVRIEYFSDGGGAMASFTAGNADYVMLPEPAVTALLSKGAEYSVVLDMQSAWNEATEQDKGFPMASTFVSDSLFESDPGFVGELIKKMKENLAFLDGHKNELTSIFANLSASKFPPASIEGCNIDVIEASQIKSVADNLLKLMLGKDMPASLYRDADPSAAAEGGEQVDIYVPYGAPELSFANIVDEMNKNGGFASIGGHKVAIHVATPQEISTNMAAGSADVAVLPTNSGANLIVNKNARFSMVCTNTTGMLYIVGKSDKPISVKDLSGKTIAAFGLNAIPGKVLETVVAHAGLTIK